MNNIKILPSILAADHGRFIEEAQSVNSEHVDTLHIDVMDGHFVPNITFGPQVVTSLKKQTSFHLDVHLMIENVDLYIPLFADAGADIITIHQEVSPHLHRSLSLIAKSAAKVGVAINPATPVHTLQDILSDIDLALVMSVNPGFGGQSFIPGALDKIAQLKRLRQQNNYRYLIEVDGGVDEHTAPKVVAAGAEFLVAGSAIFGKKNRHEAIQRLINAIAADQSGQVIA